LTSEALICPETPMTNNIEQASFEAALSDTAYKQQAQACKESLSIQRPLAGAPPGVHCQTTGAVVVLSPPDGEGGVETQDLDLLQAIPDDAADPSCPAEPCGAETVDSPTKWVDLTDGWAL